MSYSVQIDNVLRSTIMNNLPKAQYMLDAQIVNDMIPYMPMQTGTFINTVRLRNASLMGSGTVCAATGVMGRYLYYGSKMIDPLTGKGARRIVLKSGEVIYRYRLGAKLIPSGVPLNYNKSANPMAGSFWYERAKQQHFQSWKDTVQRVLVNGQ